jgi:hypothetical protein
LVRDQELEHTLAQPVLGRVELVVWMGEDAGAEDNGQVSGVHPILVRLARKDAEEVEHIQEQVLVCARELADEPSVGRDCLVLVDRFPRERLSEGVVHVDGNDGLRHLGKIPPKNAGDVVCRPRFLFPIHRLAILQI